MPDQVEKKTVIGEDRTASEERVVTHATAEGSPPTVASSRTEVYDAAAAKRRSATRVVQLVYLLFGIIEALIGLRVILKLLAANPQNAFAQFIYGITSPMLAPFAGIFATPASQGYVLELHSLLAIIVYALVAYALVRMVWVIAGTSHTE